MEESLKFDLEAEKFVISSILSDKEALLASLDVLKPMDFADRKNREVYTSIHNLFVADSPVDYLTILSDLRKRKVLSTVGSQYLADISLIAPTSQNIKHYANIVRECSIRRQLDQLSKTLALESTDPSISPTTLLENAEKLIFDLARNNSDRDFKSIKDLISESYERAVSLSKDTAAGKTMRGIPTGFNDLDNQLGGFQDSNLIIIGARPGGGKTSMMLNIASHMASVHKKRVGIFSLEMSKEELVDRIISVEGHLDLWKIRMGHIDESRDGDTFSEVLAKYEEGDFLIDDTPGLTMTDIRTKARKMQLEGGLDALFVDYIQLIIGGKSFKESNRAQEVAEISRAMKNLARELNIPVVAGSQLSRGVESRNDRTPQLSDLRESGSIEQDADVVLFLHREDMYNKETDRQGIADIIIAKHRNGPTGSVELKWIKEFATFANLQKE